MNKVRHSYRLAFNGKFVSKKPHQTGIKPVPTKPRTLTNEEARKVKEELSNQIAALSEAIRNTQRAIGAGNNQNIWLEANVMKLTKQRDELMNTMNSIRE